MTKVRFLGESEQSRQDRRGWMTAQGIVAIVEVMGVTGGAVDQGDGVLGRPDYRIKLDRRGTRDVDCADIDGLWIDSR